MLQNYFRIAFRNLANQKVYNAVNVGGLSVGLAACILILLFVNHELSYDQWIPESERVYRSEVAVTFPSSPTEQGESIQPVVGKLMAEQLDGIELSVRFIDREIALSTNENAFEQEVTLSDPDIFEMFGIKLLQGNATTALSQPNNIVLSESDALRIFGPGDIIGKTLKANGKDTLKVTGVMPEWPQSSDLDVKALVPVNSPIIANEPWLQYNWGSFAGHTYIRLRKGIDIAAFTDSYNALTRRIGPANYYQDHIDRGLPIAFEYYFTPAVDAHLKSQDGDDSDRGSIQSLISASIVAILILAIAVMNVTNLGTMLALKRVKEVAIRKALGANSKHLVVQILVEAIVLSALSIMLSLALVELFLPVFGMMMDRPLTTVPLYQITVLVPLIGFAGFIGIISGLYPALVAARFRPVDHLNGIPPTVGTRFRNALMTAQFSATIGLLATCFVVFLQAKYAESRDTGFNSSELIQIDGIDRPAVLERTESFIAALGRIPGVETLAASHGAPGHGYNNWENANIGDRKRVRIRRFSVSEDFFKTMGIRPLAGRLFSKDHVGDAAKLEDGYMSTSIVLNRSAVQELGLDSPMDAIGKPVTLHNVTPIIVGVVDDVRMESARNETVPTFFWIGPKEFRHIMLRVAPNNIPATLASIDRVWRDYFPDIPISRQFVDQAFASYYESERRRGWLLLGSSAVMVIIATMGLFALAALTTERRAREIGIRKVLGARTRNIVNLLLWQFSTPVLIATAIAWPVAWWALQSWLDTFVDRISLSAIPFVSASLFVLIIAGLTIVGHSIRVANANPIKALRCE